MTTIFLNLGRRKIANEVLPKKPFRAFVKFQTEHNRDGGVAILPIEDKGSQMGTVMFDWGTVEVRRIPKRGKYFIGAGSLEQIDLLPSIADMPDDQQFALAVQAIKQAGWAYHLYDSKLDSESARVLFQTWVQDNQ